MTTIFELADKARADLDRNKNIKGFIGVAAIDTPKGIVRCYAIPINSKKNAPIKIEYRIGNAPATKGAASVALHA